MLCPGIGAPSTPLTARSRRESTPFGLDCIIRFATCLRHSAILLRCSSSGQHGVGDRHHHHYPRSGIDDGVRAQQRRGVESPGKRKQYLPKVIRYGYGHFVWFSSRARRLGSRETAHTENDYCVPSARSSGRRGSFLGNPHWPVVTISPVQVQRSYADAAFYVNNSVPYSPSPPGNGFRGLGA